MKTRFLWDKGKEELNLEKHGVDFKLASRAFADPFVLTIQYGEENGEWRWKTYGMIDGHLIMMVAHTLWEEDEDGETVEVIRIMSARPADRTEKKRYEREPRYI